MKTTKKPGRKALFELNPEIYEISPVLRCRFELNLTVKELANLMNITSVTINNLQYGFNERLTPKFLNKLFQLYSSLNIKWAISMGEDKFKKEVQNRYKQFKFRLEEHKRSQSNDCGIDTNEIDALQILEAQFMQL